MMVSVKRLTLRFSARDRCRRVAVRAGERIAARDAEIEQHLGDRNDEDQSYSRNAKTQSDRPEIAVTYCLPSTS